jgi:anti-sigma factor RsiW
LKDKHISLDQLTDYIEGRLSGEEQRQVEYLLTHSPAARRQLESFRTILRTLAMSPDRPQAEEYLERLESLSPPDLSLPRQAFELLTLAFLPGALRVLALLAILTLAAVFVMKQQKTIQDTASELPPASSLKAMAVPTSRPAKKTPTPTATPEKPVLPTITSAGFSREIPAPPLLLPSTEEMGTSATASLTPSTGAVQSTIFPPLLIFPDLQSATGE